MVYILTVHACVLRWRAYMAQVTADKQREVRDGHDGTWVAHPALVPIAKTIFDAGMTTPNQVLRHLVSFGTSVDHVVTFRSAF